MIRLFFGGSFADWSDGLADATVSGLAAHLLASNTKEARQSGLELIARRVALDPNYCTRDPIVREAALRDEFAAERTPRGVDWQMVGCVAAANWPAEILRVIMKTVAPYEPGRPDIQRPVVKAACVADPSVTWREVVDGLRASRGRVVYEYLYQWLVLELPPNLLLEWARAGTPDDRCLLAAMTPLPNDENLLLAQSPQSDQLNEVARRLLIEFSEEEWVRGILAKKALTARNSVFDPPFNIGIGPESERYRRQAERAERWARDPALEVQAWANAVAAQLRTREASARDQETEQGSPKRL